MAAFLSEAAEWARGRWWPWRALLLLLLAWDGSRHLMDPQISGLFGGITFGVHEFGHLLFAAFGEVMTVLGGSLAQLLVPIGAGALLYHHRDYFGVAAAGAWLASSLIDLARYVGDARAFDLDLIGFGEDAVHDWAWLLGRFGMLPYDTTLAGLLRGAAILLLVVSLLFGTWLCRRMWATTRAGRVGPAPS